MQERGHGRDATSPDREGGDLSRRLRFGLVFYPGAYASGLLFVPALTLRGYCLSRRLRLGLVGKLRRQVRIEVYRHRIALLGYGVMNRLIQLADTIEIPCASVKRPEPRLFISLLPETSCRIGI